MDGTGCCGGIIGVQEYCGLFSVFVRMTLPDAVLWSALGEVLRAKGDSANALPAFRNALALKPDSSWLQSVVQEMNNESLSTALGDQAPRQL